jgi:hypothetical protein
MNLICFFKGHKPELIANFGKPGYYRRALWQCTRCKEVIMEAPSEFYDKRTRKYPIW